MVQVQGYNEWDICEAFERRILIKSSYYDILENCGVPKSTICRSLNLIFPPLKLSSLKHLWDIIVVGKINEKIVREFITFATVKTIYGPKNYLLKDEEECIVVTSEIYGAHGLPRDSISLGNGLENNLHDVGKKMIGN